MNISSEKTKVTATISGFDLLGWHFKVQYNGKFRSQPSEENFKAFREKVKNIVNCSNYGAETKSTKQAHIVRGWRNYHRYCKLDGARFNLFHMSNRAWKVFNKEKKLNRYQVDKLRDKAFPKVSHSENKFVNVKGSKSPFDGDLVYWSKRNSKLYNGRTAKTLHKQHHSCGHCGLAFVDDEMVHLHHVDGNPQNWKQENLLAIHESCHHYIHMGKRELSPN